MTIINTSLPCRLLCAAESAYGIYPNKPFQKKQPYYDNVGFIEEPSIIAGGIDEIDAALVGVNADGIIVAFRGTLPPEPPYTLPILLDWIQDFIVVPEKANGFPGTIHAGFYIAIKNLWQGVLQEVQTLRKKPNFSSAKIYITGHSKGGALASLGAWLLLQTNNGVLTPTQIITFASPHAGNVDFAKQYNSKLSQIRYENYLDIVPFVPPEIEFVNLLEKIPGFSKKFPGVEAWDYMPVGTLQYITKDGAVESDRPGLGALRIAEIIVDLLTGRVDDVTNAHSLVKYKLDYCRSVCTDMLCRDM